MPSDGKRIESTNNDDFKGISDIQQCSDGNSNILPDIFLQCSTNTIPFSEKEIIPELDQIKQEIEKIISQKENVNKENEVLKIYQDAFAELKGQNNALIEKVQQLEALDTSRAASKSVPEIVIENYYQSINDIQRSSPDGQELDDECQSTKLNDTKQDEILHFQEKIVTLLTEKDVLFMENKDLLEKNK